MDLLLASGNAHKKEEFSRIFTQHTLILPSELQIEFSVDETGDSFTANALLKAEDLFEKTDKSVISDDSGLCVDALNGEPGIYTARYGEEELGPSPTSRDRYLYLLKNLEGITDRSARFVCSLVYYFGKDRFICIQETVEGEIALEPSGTGGFGYDPVFFLPQYGCTMAEIDPEIKNEISHRGKASSVLKKILEFL